MVEASPPTPPPAEPSNDAAPDADGLLENRAMAPAQAHGEPAEQARLQEEIATLKDRWLRAKAESENARRRAQLDVEDARRYGASDLLRELLPVLDSLQRALATAGESSLEQLVEGLRLTEQLLDACLSAQGVTPVEADPGTPFDPALHRAVVEQPATENAPGTILAEIVRGYRLRDRLLREAQVVVARDAEPETPDAHV